MVEVKTETSLEQGTLDFINLLDKVLKIIRMKANFQNQAYVFFNPFQSSFSFWLFEKSPLEKSHPGNYYYIHSKVWSYLTKESFKQELQKRIINLGWTAANIEITFFEKKEVNRISFLKKFKEIIPRRANIAVQLKPDHSF